MIRNTEFKGDVNKLRFTAQFPDFNGKVTNDLHYIIYKSKYQANFSTKYATRLFKIKFFADKTKAKEEYDLISTGPFKRLKYADSDPVDEEKTNSSGEWKKSKLLKLWLNSDIFGDGFNYDK